MTSYKHRNRYLGCNSFYINSNSIMYPCKCHPIFIQVKVSGLQSYKVMERVLCTIKWRMAIYYCVCFTIFTAVSFQRMRILEPSLLYQIIISDITYPIESLTVVVLEAVGPYNTKKRRHSSTKMMDQENSNSTTVFYHVYMRNVYWHISECSK